MRRNSIRPYGQSMSGMRLISMLMATLVLWMLYDRLKDPPTWRAIADDREIRPAKEPRPEAAERIENLVPGPNDQDQDEVAKVNQLFDAVTDRAPLKPREMEAYWRLLDWSRTQP